jgi:hypothetical protein
MTLRALFSAPGIVTAVLAMAGPLAALLFGTGAAHADTGDLWWAAIS